MSRQGYTPQMNFRELRVSEILDIILGKSIQKYPSNTFGLRAIFTNFIHLTEKVNKVCKDELSGVIPHKRVFVSSVSRKSLMLY
jgi:hypothetical protein